MNELISVILPVYNGEKYLKYSIESILEQTYENFELIIINDGSTDNSLKIIEEYQKIDYRIVVISRENKGLVPTLNEGLMKAKGKYIARMDQDDISMKNRFEQQLAFIITNNLVLCGSFAKVIDEEGKYLENRTVPTKYDKIKKMLQSCTNTFYHPSVMFKKIEYVYYNECAYYCEDYEMWLKYLELGKVGNIPEYLLEYRLESNSITNSKRYLVFYNVSRLFFSYVKAKLNHINIIKEPLSCKPKFSMNTLERYTSSLYSHGLLYGYKKSHVLSLVYRGLAVLLSPDILWIYFKRAYLIKKLAKYTEEK